MAKKKNSNLGDVLVKPRKVPLEFCINPESVLAPKGWKYLKGAKDEPRKGTDGFTYEYKEGPMVFPDALDKPSRTIVTGEGGPSPSRFKHVVKFRPTKKMREHFNLDDEEAQKVRAELGLKKSEWLRRLIPIELERLNMFPDDHTIGQSDTKRAFFMGNALVVGVVGKLNSGLLEAMYGITKVIIPREMFLERWRKGKDSEKAKRRKMVQDAGKSWGVSPVLLMIQKKLQRAVTNDPESKETQDLIDKLSNMREDAKKKMQGIDFTPSCGYPGGRKIIFIKPGKESFNLVKRSGQKVIQNEFDMLPIVISGDGEEVRLSTQKIDRPVSLGQMARELAIIRRFSEPIFDEVCAILVRMAYYYDEDHEVFNDSWAWNPKASILGRINQLHEQLSDRKDEPIDLWNFLLVCHSVSIQEEVKYHDHDNHDVGRHNTLTSLIIYSELIGNDSDDVIEHWANELDSIVGGNVATGIRYRKLIDRFEDLLISVNPDTSDRFKLESMTISEIKGFLKKSQLPTTGNKPELINRMLKHQS